MCGPAGGVYNYLMRFSLNIDTDNAAAQDMADLTAILTDVLARIANMTDNGNDLDGSDYTVRDANGNSIGGWMGIVEAAGRDTLFGIAVEDGPDYDEHDPFRDDVEADADVLAMAGWGTDEDYGYYGDDEY